jgi:hypothetical protein
LAKQYALFLLPKNEQIFQNKIIVQIAFQVKIKLVEILVNTFKVMQNLVA